jgi:hypothetical protein
MLRLSSWLEFSQASIQPKLSQFRSYVKKNSLVRYFFPGMMIEAHEDFLTTIRFINMSHSSFLINILK